LAKKKAKEADALLSTPKRTQITDNPSAEKEAKKEKENKHPVNIKNSLGGANVLFIKYIKGDKLLLKNALYARKGE